MSERPAWRTWVFAGAMLLLTVVFVLLGNWQMARLAEKEALIASVETGLASPAVPIAEADPELAYRPVTLAGTFVPEGTVLVFTSLSDARGRYGGPGYWVMTPLALEGGGTVFVNRGFVPDGAQGEFLGTAPAGRQELTGLVRTAEAASSFTPAPDAAKQVEWVRDPARLAALAGDLPQPVLPLTVDLPAGAPGELPQGGETVVSFRNNHLGYAYTWYGFALITPILLFFWLRRQRRPARR